MTAAAFAATRRFAREHGQGAAIYLASFIGSKAVAFLGPLVLAAALRPDIYGALEMALSTGLVLAMVSSLGLWGAVPRVTLRANPIPIIDILALFLSVAGLAFFLAGLAVAATGLGAAAALVCFVSMTSAAQGALTALCRTYSRRNVAVWVEGLATHVAIAVALASLLIGAARIEHVAALSGLACAALTLGAFIVFLRTRRADLAARLRSVMRTSLPLLGYSLVSVWLATSPRVLIGALLPAGFIAVYAVDFRFAGLLLGINMLMMTGLFRRIYQMRTRRFDRLGAIYAGALAIISLAFALAVPVILAQVEMKALADAGARDAAIAVFPLVMAQIYCWAVSAMLQMRVSRARLVAPAVALQTILAAATAGLFLWLTQTGMGFAGAVVLLLGQSVGVNLIELGLLARKGLVMPRLAMSWAAAVALLASVWLLA
ncbi:MAG: hypothetical protein R3D33_01345 [Hyphomicrobiaceae bacterium]